MGCGNRRYRILPLRSTVVANQSSSADKVSGLPDSGRDDRVHGEGEARCMCEGADFTAVDHVLVNATCADDTGART